MVADKIKRNLVDEHLVPAGKFVLKTVAALLVFWVCVPFIQMLSDCLGDYDISSIGIKGFYFLVFGWILMIALCAITFAAVMYGFFHLYVVMISGPFWLIRFLIWGLIIEPIRIKKSSSSNKASVAETSVEIASDDDKGGVCRASLST